MHADWTELVSCVDQELDKNEGGMAKRRYFYITLLRAPVVRYLSEFRHVQRGATWKTARHWCLGRQATAEELPPCYSGISLSYTSSSFEPILYLSIHSLNSFFFVFALFSGENWMGVQLDEFMNCDSNLATNRQTRMLSDLAIIGCYNKSSMPAHERDRIMLASAKRNLAAMSYFGLTEYQKVTKKNKKNLRKKIDLNKFIIPFYFHFQISQYVFEETFNLRFAIPFEQHNSTVSSSTLNHLRPDQRNKIEQLNALDTELYEFAKKLLFQRFERLKAKDTSFDARFNHLGLIGAKNGITEFNWDRNLDDINGGDNNHDH